MDEMTLALLGSLVEIRTELGEDVYVAAVERARVAVACEVMVEAERRALRAGRQRRDVGNVTFLDLGSKARRDGS